MIVPWKNQYVARHFYRFMDRPIDSSNLLWWKSTPVDVSTETAVQGLVGIGTPAPVAAAVGQSFEAIRDGKMVTVKDTVIRVTGRQPRSFQSWAREHASQFA
jgi:hypothetical protein